MFRMDKRKTSFYCKDGETLEKVNGLSLEMFGIRFHLINLN